MSAVLEAHVGTEQRFAQMQAAVDSGFPFLRKQQVFKDTAVSIVGFGPSLLDTWQTIEKLHQNQVPIIATSGSYDFLCDRGVVPDAYVVIDPQPHKLLQLPHPRQETIYLMASCVYPEFWNRLAGHDVAIWHAIQGNEGEVEAWVKQNHPEGQNSLIGGGSTVAQRAMNVAAALGYRKFNLFGLDGSFLTHHHAGDHPAEKQPRRWHRFNGKTYRTTPQLLQSALEMAEFLKTYDVEAKFYGSGLIQDMARAIERGQL